MSDFADLMEPVARRLFKEPNPRLSSKNELRFGSNGSLSITLDGPNRGTFFDHEAGEGGGVLDLIRKARGGDRRAALEWLKAEFGDIAGQPEPPRQHGRVVATYSYEDETGQPLFEVVRMEPKDFRQRRPDGTWGVKGVRLVPYQLPAILEAMAQERPIFVVEGEKDVHRLSAFGIVATTNAGGAGKWRDEYSLHFGGADVVILPDNDEAGRTHAEAVARSIAPVARRVRVVDLPGLPRKGDVSDYFATGATVEQLWTEVDQAPTWKPTLRTSLPFVWFGDEAKAGDLSWLVKGMFPAGGLAMIYGPPGTSKSFVAVDLGLHIAHGRAWFGRKVKRAPVAYVTGEGGAGMKRRMRAWRQENHGEAGAPFALIPSSINLHDDDEGVDQLIGDLKAAGEMIGEPFGCVVLDTLARMIGSGDEDRAPSIMAVVKRAERIQRETGALVLIVHHSGKEKGRGARGSNALEGAVDCSIEVSRVGESDVFMMCSSKVKDGEEIEPIRYTLAQSVVGQDEDGEDITSCVIRAADASPSEDAPRTRLTDTDRIALDALTRAVEHHGRKSMGGEIPQGVVYVSSDEWRACAYAMGLSASDDDAAKRQAFHRARQRLLASHMISEWNGVVWRVRV